MYGDVPLAKSIDTEIVRVINDADIAAASRVRVCEIGKFFAFATSCVICGKQLGSDECEEGKDLKEGNHYAEDWEL